MIKNLLRNNFPTTIEEAKNFDVEIRDEKGVFKIFVPNDPTSLNSIKDSVNEVNIFLVKNGYDIISVKKFIENDFYYESSDNILLLGKHGYLESFVLFIEKE
jgi:hypothetical protein